MGNGFLLLYKRFENGTLTWPRTSEEAAELTEEHFRYLMLGLNPYYYFIHILTELPKLCDEQGHINPADLDYLMPWAKGLPDECRKPHR